MPSVFTCCRNFKKKGPLKNKCQRKAVKILFEVCGYALLFLFGCGAKVEHVDVDYSYFLGRDYKKGYKDIKKTSTIICNHVSCLDSMAIVHAYFTAFAVADDYKKVPVLRTIFNAADCLFMPRGGTDEARQKTLELIMDR